MENQLLEKENYLCTKYYLDNLKKQRLEILNNPTTFTGFDRMSSTKDNLLKEYYDTPDFFFQDRGVAIHVNTVKGRKTKELVVRFDTEKERIRFLSDIPDTFSINIGKKESIYQYAEFIAESVGKLVPSGLTINIAETVKTLKNVFSIEKKRERYTFINIKGLKVKFDFADTLFYSSLNRKKERLFMLEITSNDVNKKEMYDEFVKKVLFNNPTIIKLKNSDLALGREQLFDELNKIDTDKKNDNDDNKDK